MELSKVVASLALLLGVMLAGGYARGDGPSGPAVKETTGTGHASSRKRRCSAPRSPSTTAARKTSRGCATGR